MHDARRLRGRASFQELPLYRTPPCAVAAVLHNGRRDRSAPPPVRSACPFGLSVRPSRSAGLVQRVALPLRAFQVAGGRLVRALGVVESPARLREFRVDVGQLLA